jgi:serine/threonine protein kinase
MVLDGLGMGGFATVVKVQHVVTKEVFAMKVVIKNMSSKAHKREYHRLQLINELKCMTTLEYSPFIQRCRFAFESPLCVYFVLDWNGGGDLFYHLSQRSKENNPSPPSPQQLPTIISLSKRYLGGHRLVTEQPSPSYYAGGFTENEVRILLAELYLALEHLHKHNIVHRDLKIENIMLSAEGHVKLVDFGLALEITQESEHMESVGSIIYLAPELIQYNTGGRHTDWWAYGVLAYELLTGNCPWSSLDDKRKIRSEIMQSIIPPIAHVSEDTSEFVASLMTRDFNSRLGTKRDVEVKTHPFFKNIHWKKMMKLKCPPAFKPAMVNISKSDRLEALEYYFRINSFAASSSQSWSVGLEDASNFLF